jgi:hypothetical protein
MPVTVKPGDARTSGRLRLEHVPLTTYDVGGGRSEADDSRMRHAAPQQTTASMSVTGASVKLVQTSSSRIIPPRRIIAGFRAIAPAAASAAARIRPPFTSTSNVHAPCLCGDVSMLGPARSSKRESPDGIAVSATAAATKRVSARSGRYAIWRLRPLPHFMAIASGGDGAPRASSRGWMMVTWFRYGGSGRSSPRLLLVPRHGGRSLARGGSPICLQIRCKEVYAVRNGAHQIPGKVVVYVPEIISIDV